MCVCVCVPRFRKFLQVLSLLFLVWNIYSIICLISTFSYLKLLSSCLHSFFLTPSFSCHLFLFLTWITEVNTFHDRHLETVSVPFQFCPWVWGRKMLLSICQPGSKLVDTLLWEAVAANDSSRICLQSTLVLRCPDCYAPKQQSRPPPNLSQWWWNK